MDIKIECANCGNEFVISTEQWKALGLNQLPKHCPACNDARQQRRPWDTVVNRECLGSWEGVLIAIPSQWFERFQSSQRGMPHPDRPAYRAVIKGNRGDGVQWTGRIDIWDHRTDRSKPGRVLHMMVEKGGGKPKKIGAAERREALADQLIAEAREEMAETEAPEPSSETMARVNDLRAEAKRLRAEVDKAEVDHAEREAALYHESYEYLRIEDCEIEEPTRALVFARVDYKTTLKGFGRQYEAVLDTSRADLAFRLSSSCRNGRFGSYMAVAIVADDAPMIGRVTGDIQKEIAWNLRSPNGEDI